MIISPMATGGGAYIVHKQLSERLKNYRVISYNPYLTLFPPLLYPIGRSKSVHLIHTTPDHGLFHYQKKVPLVLTFHNYVLDYFMRDYSTLFQKVHYQTDLKLFIRKSLEKAQKITAVSGFLADIIKKDLNIKKDIEVIYNGIDEQQFYPIRKKPANTIIKVFLNGNLTLRKGIQWIIPIIKRLNRHIHIYYTKGLRNKSRLPAHERLHCIGNIKHKEMQTIYNNMDILLFPTVREGFGLVAAEAMACGLPVVASNCSALPELIDEGKGGFLCSVGNVDQFADRIHLLAENPGMRREFGEYNRVKVENYFTMNRMVHQYKKLFEKFKIHPGNAAMES